MDSTYKKNKYRQPLFEIVDVTSTELTFSIAIAYMESEQTENFCWVLDKLKQLFTKQGLWPQVILTERDLALMKTIEIVFPRTSNLLCRFLINKNVKAKCKEYVVADTREAINTLWMKLVCANDEVEYHQWLHALILDNFFRAYIEDIIDVELDGNCGYRIIASLHGYGEYGWSMIRRDLEIELRGHRSILYENLFGDYLSVMRESFMISCLGTQPIEK